MKEITDFENDEAKEEFARKSRLLNVPLAPVESLAAFVVVYRTLGIDKELAMACMRELAKRREDGCEFDYEGFIEVELAKMPQPQNMNLAVISQDVHKGITNNLRITKLRKGFKL